MSVEAEFGLAAGLAAVAEFRLGEEGDKKIKLEVTICPGL